MNEKRPEPTATKVINSACLSTKQKIRRGESRGRGGDSAIIGRPPPFMVYVCSQPARIRQEVIPMKKATIRVPGIKVAVPLKADAIPRNLVPMEGPAGEPVIELVLEGSPLTALAKLNGKNYRKLVR